MQQQPNRAAGSNRSGPIYLNCPRCGLSIRPKADWLAVEHCPRCIARSRGLVRMFASSSRHASCTPPPTRPTPTGLSRCRTPGRGGCCGESPAGRLMSALRIARAHRAAALDAETVERDQPPDPSGSTARAARSLAVRGLPEGWAHPLALSAPASSIKCTGSRTQPARTVHARSWHARSVLTHWWQAAQSGPSRRADASRPPADGLNDI
jgi:hypothetical protein